MLHKWGEYGLFRKSSADYRGGRGIGKATALALARGGADVVVNYLQNAEAAAETVEMIRGFGRKALAVAADVGKHEDVEQLFEKIDASFSRIDILVNNAGTGALIPLESITTEFWDRVLQVDLTGPFLCTQAAARRMIPKRYGRIINISSIAGINGMDVDPTYSAANRRLAWIHEISGALSWKAQHHREFGLSGTHRHRAFAQRDSRGGAGACSQIFGTRTHGNTGGCGRCDPVLRLRLFPSRHGTDRCSGWRDRDALTAIAFWRSKMIRRTPERSEPRA